MSNFLHNRGFRYLKTGNTTRKGKEEEKKEAKKTQVECNKPESSATQKLKTGLPNFESQTFFSPPKQLNHDQL